MFFKVRKNFALLLSCAYLFTSSVAGFSLSFGDDLQDPHKTGARKPSLASKKWMEKNLIKVKDVKINEIGLNRINEERAKNGKSKLPAKTANLGDDFIAEVEDSTSLPGGALATSDVTNTYGSVATAPTSVDNSKLIYFPPIRSQGSLGSCGAFSSTYYQMTYMTALARNIDVRNNSDNTNKFSPKFTFNMLNEGITGRGVWPVDCFALALSNGVPSWSDFPYDSNDKAWPTDVNVWKNALNNRMAASGSVSGLNTDAGITTVKNMLNNGYIFNYCTYIKSWVYSKVANDPSTTADDSIAGKNIVTDSNGTSGFHAMTLVGYNDDIWTDINGNGIIDADEKGAFRIANSWGTSWNEAGFAWISYYAVKNRNLFYSNTVYWITARSSYTPKLIGVVTANHSLRNQMSLGLGYSSTSQTTPSQKFSPTGLTRDGGAWAFNGTSTPVDATFALDFTDFVTPTLESSTTKSRWYLTGSDYTFDTSPLSIQSFKLINTLKNEEVMSLATYPINAEGTSFSTYIDYAMGNTQPSPTPTPTATSTSTPVATTTPILSPTPTSTSILSPTPTSTSIPTPDPTPTSTPIQTSTPVPIPTSTPIPTPIPLNFSIEAESAQLSNAEVINTTTGYTGSGFVRFTTTNNSDLSFNITAPQTGIYTLSIRYSNDSKNTTTPLSLKINGVSTENVDLPKTRSYDKWGIYTVSINLIGGANTLTLSTIDKNNMYIDNLQIK